jgi:hypothetical protein
MGARGLTTVKLTYTGWPTSPFPLWIDFVEQLERRGDPRMPQNVANWRFQSAVGVGHPRGQRPVDFVATTLPQRPF